MGIFVHIHKENKLGYITEFGCRDYTMEKNASPLLSLKTNTNFMQLLYLMLILHFFTGCASTTVFTPYPVKVAPLISTLTESSPTNQSVFFEQEIKENDKILYLLERGRYAHIQGDYKSSISNFENAISEINISDEKAVVSLSDAGAVSASILLNDNAIPYVGKGYERVMLHHFQALNYLAEGNVEGAGVEVRIANSLQEEAFKAHEAEVDRMKEQMPEDALLPKDNKSKLTGTNNVGKLINQLVVQPIFRVSIPDDEMDFSVMDSAANKVLNSFQNAYTLYVSAVIHEILKEDNDAYIDYEKARKIYPKNMYLVRNVIAFANKLEMTDDLKRLKRIYPRTMSSSNILLKVETGNLVVLYEEDFVPQKQQLDIIIPHTASETLTKMALPIYDAKAENYSKVIVRVDGGAPLQTELICDVYALASKSLKEDYGIILMRQALRYAAKAASAKLLKDKVKGLSGTLSKLGISTSNIVTENADLRSWSTLPRSAQILQVKVPPGSHKISITVGDSNVNVDVKINKGKKAILRAVKVGSNISCSRIY